LTPNYNRVGAPRGNLSNLKLGKITISRHFICGMCSGGVHCIVYPDVEGRVSYAFRAGGGRKGARGPRVFHMFLPFLVVPLFADCTNKTFHSKPTSLCNWHYFRFSVKRFLSVPPLLGGSKNLYRSRTRSRRLCLYPPRIPEFVLAQKFSLYKQLDVLCPCGCGLRIRQSFRDQRHDKMDILYPCKTNIRRYARKMELRRC